MNSKFRVFVTATDTNVGKTETSCALLELMKERNMSPIGFKPYETGCADLSAPSDASAHKLASGQTEPLEMTCLHRFELPLAPGVAAQRLGRDNDFEKTLQGFHAFDNRSLVVKGAGGLFVPLDAQRNVMDLIQACGLPVLLVARASLGTINHSALSIEALKTRKIPILGVVMSTQTPSEDPAVKDNAEWVAKHNVRVFGPIPYTEDSAKRRELFKRTLAPLLA